MKKEKAEKSTCPRENWSLPEVVDTELEDAVVAFLSSIRSKLRHARASRQEIELEKIMTHRRRLPPGHF